MTTISDPSAMTPDDPRWLSWFMQQRRFDRLSRKAQTGASLITDFASGVYEMGYPGQRRGSYELSDIVKVSRSTGGGRVNSSGVYEWVGNDVPRLTHNPVTLQPLGLLVEEQRTNLVLNSALLATQNVTVTAVAHTLSFYGTGTVTLSGVATGSKAGSGAYPERSELTFTPTAGVLTLTVTGSVTFGQLEVGSSASSYIPTTAAQVTRAADVATVNTLSPWYNATEGTIVVRFIMPTVSGFPGVVRIGQADINYSIGAFLSSGQTITSIVKNATDQAVFTTGGLASGTSKSFAMSYKANDFKNSFNGLPAQSDTSGSVPAVTLLQIGRYGTNNLNGIIASITYYPRVINVQQASA